tara:strand:+ start:774 stop:1118 length:345 start_codon:yes stop_codon:yes gene_type:complete
MTITYKWNVSQLMRVSEPEPDTVARVESYLHGKDDKGYSQTQVFTVSLSLPESYSSGSFISYDNLTKDEVIGWVLSVLGTKEQDRLKALVSKKIEDHYNFVDNPTVFDKPTVPW